MASPLLGERTRRRFSFLINFLFWGVCIAVIVLAGRFLVRVLLPFLAAFLLAALLQRPIRFLERRFSFTHSFAAGAVGGLSLLAVGGGIGAGAFFGGRFLIGLLKKEETLAALQSGFEGVKDTFTAFGEQVLSALPREMAQTVTAFEQSVLEKLSAFLAAFAGDVLSFTVEALPHFLLTLLFFVLAFLFFARDYEAVVGFIGRQIPTPQRPLVKAAVSAFTDTFFSSIKAYFILGLLTFGQTAIGFLVLKMPYPFLLAFITALVDALPILGVGTVLLPMAVFKLLARDTFSGIGLIVVYAAVTAIRNLLQPRILSRETGLSPLLTLLSMFVGWRLAGVVGLLLTPILAMVFVRLHKEGHLHVFH